MYSFTAMPYYPGPYTNSDGARPNGLVLSGDTLFGTAERGGSMGCGTIFAVKTNGTGFTVLYTFTGGSDGYFPYDGLVCSGNSLYGTTDEGGNGSPGNGTVLRVSFLPQLTINPSGVTAVLTWPSNYAGFDYTGFRLQSAPTITGTFTNIPGATSPYTNAITGGQQFFRLISN